jgi:signal transduction histidine kinase
MSLRWKMGLQIGCMIVGLLLVSFAAMWGLNGLHQDYGQALSGYEELREVYSEVGLPLAMARELLNVSPSNRDWAARQVESATQRFQILLALSHARPSSGPIDPLAETDMLAALTAANRQFQQTHLAEATQDMHRADLKAVENATLAMRSFATRLQQTTKARQDAAARKRHDTIAAVELLCGAVIAGAIVLGILQYRSVMLPLQRLGAGVRRVAAGEFTQRLDARGGREFAGMADEFNRMAAELDEFYHRLEDKVAAKSKELIRSERLAGVGYLAAGVAHEINNPLGIIAGYAEYSLEQLKGGVAPEADPEFGKSLQVICDEAFRCKQIISQLLSLARPGETSRSPVDLAKVAADVAGAVRGLRDYNDRNLTIIANGPLYVMAEEAEMKQNILNLAVNALEAVPPSGQVQIEVGRTNGWIELRVRDNGRGMTEQVLEHVFEPFFTDKRGVREPGTGLGLSITHAIVESHGGRITAASAGPGKGSEFLVRLPAAAQRSVA